MPFFELLQNTDILITVSPLPWELAQCLPMSGTPYELSLGNRPLLWHCLAPLVDAGALNFYISTTAEWRSNIKTCLEQFAAHYHLKTNLEQSDDNNNNNQQNTRNNNKQQNQQQSSFSNSQSSSSSSANVIVGEVNFFFVTIEESEYRDDVPVAQVVSYAKDSRPANSVRDFMVVNFDTLLSPEVIKTFLQGFQTNFASASVLYAERNLGTPDDAESDLICVDDDVSAVANANNNNNNNNGESSSASSDSMFAEHRRLHLSESLPCDTKHDFPSSMLMRRPQMLFTKNFKQLPVYLFRPWVAQALRLHFESANDQQQQEKQQSGNNNNNNKSSKKQQQSQQQTQQQQQQQQFYQPMSKFREDFIPALLLCQFSSFAALAEDEQRANSNKIRFRTVTSSERLMEELSLPAQSNFKIRPHWALNATNGGTSALLTTNAAAVGAQQQQQQQQAAMNNSGNQNLNSASLNDPAVAASLGLVVSPDSATSQNQHALFTNNNNQQIDNNNDATINNNNNNNTTNNAMTVINGERQQLVTSSFGGVLLPTPSLDVLNAAGPSLAPPNDEIRVFCTLVRKNNTVTNPSTMTTTTTNEFPIAKRVDSVAAYDSIAALIRDGLEIPPPPLVCSIQKYAVPDLHTMTYNSLVEDFMAKNGNNNNNNNASASSSSLSLEEAPKNFLRCGLLTVPPTPGYCRVERCIIGKNVKFGEKCAIFDSVIMDDVELGNECTLRSCVVCPKTNVQEKAQYASAIICGGRVEYISKTKQGQ